MSLNKTVLAGAIAGLLVSANAGAVILGTDDARVYAQELVKPVMLTDAADTIQFDLGYNFSGGEVRYGRLECTANVEIDNATIVEASNDISLGAINGQGTEALFFSITATDPVSGATDAIVLDVASDITLLDNAAVDCAFSIYDQPSQAQAGGTTGRIYTTGFAPFIASASGFAFSGTPGLATASVEAVNGAYTEFLASTGSDFGDLSLGAVAGVLDSDGNAITLADIFDLGNSSITVSGDFSAATNVTLNSVSAVDANDFAAGSAEFAIPGPLTDAVLDYVENGTDAIQASTYAAAFNATTNTGYEVGAIADVDAGEIDRDGTELQAPLAQVPNGYLSRMVLTNTGNDAREYNIAVFGETGNTIGTGNLTGTVPANGTVVVDLNTVLTSFTGSARATLNVTVAAPTTQIQGLYQIVNPASGSISNHAMIRPGTN